MKVLQMLKDWKELTLTLGDVVRESGSDEHAEFVTDMGGWVSLILDEERGTNDVVIAIEKRMRVTAKALDEDKSPDSEKTSSEPESEGDGMDVAFE